MGRGGHLRVYDAEKGHAAARQHQGREIRADAKGDVAVSIGRGDEEDGAIERRGGHPVPGLAVGEGQETRAPGLEGGALGRRQEDGFGAGFMMEAGPVCHVHPGDPGAEKGEAACQLRVCLEKVREAERLAAGAADIEPGACRKAVAKRLEGVGKAGIGQGAALRGGVQPC